MTYRWTARLLLRRWTGDDGWLDFIQEGFKKIIHWDPSPKAHPGKHPCYADLRKEKFTLFQTSFRNDHQLRSMSQCVNNQRGNLTCNVILQKLLENLVCLFFTLVTDARGLTAPNYILVEVVPHPTRQDLLLEPCSVPSACRSEVGGNQRLSFFSGSTTPTECFSPWGPPGAYFGML